jgi:drug/metabolite transporter (DMT)-like permease
MQSALSSTPPGERQDNALLAILCVCGGVALAATLDAAVKWLSGDYPVHQLLVLRCIVAAPVLFAMTGMRGREIATLHPHWPIVVLRALIMCSAYLAFVMALAAMPMADAVALYFALPLFVAALAGPMLGERVGIERWLAIVAGFIGVLIMIRPGAGVFEPAALLALYAAFGYGTGQMLTRWLGFGIRAPVLAFQQNVIYLIVGTALSLAFGFGQFAVESHPSLDFLVRGWTTPPAADLALILSLGVITGLAMVLYTQAYRLSESNLVAPFEYTAMFWATLYGFVVFGDFPDWVTGAGALLVIGAGLYMLRIVRRRRPPTQDS